MFTRVIAESYFKSSGLIGRGWRMSTAEAYGGAVTQVIIAREGDDTVSICVTVRPSPSCYIWGRKRYFRLDHDVKIGVRLADMFLEKMIDCCCPNPSPKV